MDHPQSATADLADQRHGAEAYVSAFNAVALPKSLSPGLRATIEARSEQARDMAEEAGFALARDHGSTDMRLKEQRQRQVDDEAIDRFASVAQQESQRREREREEWAKTKSTVAGVTMTGGEWAQLAERMRNDEEFRRKLIETFEARGMSQAEAEARYERVADISEIAAKPPGQRSEQEAETFKRAQADQTLAQDLKDTTRLAADDPTAKSLPSSTIAMTQPAPAPRVVSLDGPGF